MTASQIALALNMALSTISAVLKRVGLGKRSKLEPPEPPNRYERRRPGELIHIDIKKLGRILRPGHRVTGNRRGQARPVRDGKQVGAAGWEFVHVAIDDHTRLAYAEVLTDEKGPTAVGFLQRAIEFYASYGVRVERVMTDNGSPYISHAHAKRASSSVFATYAPGPTGPGPTARPSDSYRPCKTSGPMAASSKPAPRHSRASAMAHALQLQTTTRRPQPQATQRTTDQRA